MDFRKADPTYTEFTPTTAAEAIDLFVRHRNLGVPVSQWPETFIHVSKNLPENELDRFQEWLILPQGPALTGQMYVPNPEIEAERKRLTKEADKRDRETFVIHEVEEEDEKVPALLRDCSLER